MELAELLKLFTDFCKHGITLSREGFHDSGDDVHGSPALAPTFWNPICRPVLQNNSPEERREFLTGQLLFFGVQGFMQEHLEVGLITQPAFGGQRARPRQFLRGNPDGDRF